MLRVDTRIARSVLPCFRGLFVIVACDLRRCVLDDAAAGDGAVIRHR